MSVRDSSYFDQLWIAAGKRVKEKEYWLEKLSGEWVKSSFPTTSAKGKAEKNETIWDTVSITYNKQTCSDLIKLSGDSNIRLHMILVSLLTLLLGKYTGNDDILIGTPILNPIFGNERQEAFINTVLTLRNQFTGDTSFKELLLQVRQTIIEAIDNQNYPIDVLIRQLDQLAWKEGDDFPLFDTAIALENIQDIDHLSEIESKIIFSFFRSEHSVEGKIKYDTHFYSGDVVERISGHFHHLTETILANPDIKFSEIDLLLPEEKKQLLIDFNDIGERFPINQTIHRLFEDQAGKSPDCIAVVGFNTGSIASVGALREAPFKKSDGAIHESSLQLTYQKLNEQSDALASKLIRHGVTPGMIVGIRIERSVEMIIGILGILKTGAAYLPINPNQPESRTDYMIKDSGAALLVTTYNEEVEKFRSWEGKNVFFLDHPNLFISQPLNFFPLPASLAYIIYTSGTTGNPKGVPITHSNVSPLLHWGYNQLELNSKDRVIQNLSYYFDWSVWEIFIALTTGASLHMITEETVLNPESEVDFILTHAITVLHITPTQVGYLLNTGKKLHTLKYLFIGAEKLTADLTRRSIESVNDDCRIFNMYGPTEATIISATLEIERGKIQQYHQLASVPIGIPTGNAVLAILDRNMNLCPIGVTGELYISGESISSGYLNKPELTVDKFLYSFKTKSFWPHLFSKRWEIYKTGDHARWLEDGTIECLGRIDHQVKLRGYRIELGEIEHRLINHPDVNEAIVILKESLIAYFVSDKKLDSSALRDYLSHVLPFYMVPSHFIQLDNIPLTPGGKQDRKNLPSPDIGIDRRYKAPEDGLEQRIAEIWMKILKRDKVGVNDNFFELGGNSLNVVQLNDALTQSLKREIPVAAMFEHLTIRSFVDYLKKENEADADAKTKEKTEKQTKPNDVAVIGMACRFPGAENIERFWSNLEQGIESLTFYTDDELKAAGIDDAMLRNPSYVKAGGGVLEDADCFDSAFFDYTPVEAAIMDPQARVLHECVWTALENAGCNPKTVAGPIGLYAGASENFQWKAMISFSGKENQPGRFSSSQLIDRDFLCSRVSHKLNLNGPAVLIQTACSTSLVAIHTACRALLNGECEIALAGGVSVSPTRLAGYLYQDGMINSRDGHCRAFDAQSSGTIRGDGVGVVVLKTLSAALADGDNIQAIIKGTAINNDGSNKANFTAPAPQGQAAVIRNAMNAANVDPETITYIETHGTATSLGDPIEIEGLKYAFHTKKKNFCALGSVKTNFGHLDAASGIAGFIKTVLSLKYRKIPPSLHFETPNPSIDLINSPFYINPNLQDWVFNDTHPRRAGVSSFGIGGTNAHVVLEEFGQGKLFEKSSPCTPAKTFGFGFYLILLSAKTPAVLDRMIAAYHDFFERNKEIDLADVAYTLQVGRASFPHRAFFVCKDLNEAKEILSTPDSGKIKRFSIHSQKTEDALTVNPIQESNENMSDRYDPDQVGHLWLHGQDIDWTKLYGEERRRKVSLPTYPFERIRYAPPANINHILSRMGPLMEHSQRQSCDPDQHPPSFVMNRPELSTPYVEASTPIEKKLVRILESFFGIGKIGVMDDFFELGGDSLKAITILEKIRNEFKTEVPIHVFFERLTIHQLGEYIHDQLNRPEKRPEHESEEAG
ncbi:MAG: amino acid adenylation domain-containing protein [Candidatus Omnitrophota bacterium]